MAPLPDINPNLDPRHRLGSIVLIGTHTPRHCGIGTFTNDLGNALTQAAPHVSTQAVALNDRPDGYRYPPRVWFEITANRPSEYRMAADFLNLSAVDVVVLQHEYGIFGGSDGEYILEMLRRLRMPVVTTLHTVLKDPTPAQRSVLERIAEQSDRVIVMAQRAVTFLQDIYGIPSHKIALIHHGIPEMPFVDPNFYKDQFGVEGRKVILTFGLLGPGKGIETMIDALPAITQAHPDVVYIVLGATHPHVMAAHGEDYRVSLQRRAEEKNVSDHIIFHNRFVEIDELIEFLGAADLYVTPYLSEAQITSGTLAYALGAGKATVSTGYWYAQEMLADGRGRIVPFKDPPALARTIVELFDQETDRHAMRKRAYTFTRQMCWPQIAQQYLDLFAAVKQQRRISPKPIYRPQKLRDKQPALPDIRLDHLRTMTDDVGLLHGAGGSVPDRKQGYRLDDNALALVAVLQAREQLPGGAGCTAMAIRYLAFLQHAFDTQSSRFRGHLSYDRQWQDTTGSDDSHGRAVWALGEAVAMDQVQGHLTPAVKLFQQALPALEQFTAPRPCAYSLIGLHAYLRRFSGDSQVRRVRELLAQRLFDLFQQHATDDWVWPEDRVTYDNGRLPLALLLSGQWMFVDELTQMGLKSLEWLIRMQTSKQGHFAPIGTSGWFPRGGSRARFDQRPMEAASIIDACLEAHRITRQQVWLDRAYRCFNWFLGENDLRTPLYDRTTGGCHSRLQPQGVSEDQDAEALVAWLLSLLSLTALSSEPRVQVIKRVPRGDL